MIARHTLATFSRLGCEEIAERGLQLERARTYLRDRELFCVEFETARPGALPAFVNLQQTHTERLLLDRVRERPEIELRWATTVRDIRQSEETVSLETDGGELEGSYAIACDGARSTVRKLLGIEFPGRSFEDRFLIADIRADLPFPHERRFFFDPPSNRGRQVLIHPQPDGELRIDWQVPAETDAEAERTSGRLDERIRALLGDQRYELAWLTSYRFHQRLAARFRQGRVFLAGDAAHLFSPFGARGLNSGVEDAANLAWKLAFVRRGEAGDALLDTYERERRPAARENLDVTGATMRFMAPPDGARRLLRDAILRGSLRSARIRAHVDSGKLATPAVYGDGDGLVGRLAPGALDELRGVFGPGFTALAVGSEERVEPSGSVPLATAPPELAPAYGGRGVYLVRPDAYVAARVGGGDPERALRSLLQGHLESRS